MREILFRGKIKDRSNIKRNGKWKYGFISGRCSYDVDGNDNVVSIDTYWMSGDIIDAKTVGQYTGLTDKNGTKIFEGDIVKEGCNGLCTEVCFVESQGCYRLKGLGDSYKAEDSQIEWEVIGNIYDNPELLPELLEV